MRVQHLDDCRELPAVLVARCESHHAGWRVVRKAIFNNDERKRLYKEAREYLALRGKRKQFVKDQRAAAGASAGAGD